jgi:hypothetical protein
MKKSEKTLQLVQRVVDEFTADWRPYAERHASALAQAANTFAAMGMGRSTSLLHAYERIHQDSLAEARSVFISRVEAVLSVLQPKPSGSLTAALEEACIAQLERLADAYGEHLRRGATDMGLTGSTPSLTRTGEALRATTRTAISGAVLRYAQSRSLGTPPWYQRPVGYIVLTIIATLLATAVTAWLLSR